MPKKKQLMTELSPTKEQIKASALRMNSGESGAYVGHQLARKLYKAGDNEPAFKDPTIWLYASELAAAEMNSGNFDGLIGRLNGHLVALEGAFVKLLLMFNDATTVEQMTRVGALALKVQSNMRNTAQTICDLKHPRQQVNFVRADTANLSNGPQQNNISQQSGGTPSHAEKQFQSNELLRNRNELDN